MAKYHVGCGLVGIYAGILKSQNQCEWRNKSECTDEAINAVRDYMVDDLLGGFECQKRNTGAYQWKLKDGRTVQLSIAIIDNRGRSNDNDCDLCKKIWNSKEEYQKSIDNHWDESNAIVMENNKPWLYIPIEDDYFSNTYMQINFCPKCGRLINPEYKIFRFIR